GHRAEHVVAPAIELRLGRGACVVVADPQVLPGLAGRRRDLDRRVVIGGRALAELAVLLVAPARDAAVRDHAAVLVGILSDVGAGAELDRVGWPEAHRSVEQHGVLPQTVSEPTDRLGSPAIRLAAAKAAGAAESERDRGPVRAGADAHRRELQRGP